MNLHLLIGMYKQNAGLTLMGAGYNPLQPASLLEVLAMLFSFSFFIFKNNSTQNNKQI